MSLVRGKWGRIKSLRDSRIAPGESLETYPVTPSTSSCRPECISQSTENLAFSASAQDVAKGPQIAWWRNLKAFSGTQNERKPKLESRHTAWAKLVCPVMAKSRRTAGSRKIQVGLSKRAARCPDSQMESSSRTQGKTETDQTWVFGAELPAPPDISLLDINKVILRGSDLDREKQRREEVQRQTRLRADKVRKMQASQCALRQKHDAKTRNKANRKDEGLSSMVSNDVVEECAPVVAEQACAKWWRRNGSAGHLCSLKEEVSPAFSAAPKDSGRTSSMSAETEATTAAELQDLDEFYLVSLPSTAERKSSQGTSSPELSTVGQLKTPDFVFQR